jgi:UDP-glucose 4-epimerase
MTHFAITGGSGRIGCSIAPRLLEHGHQVRTIDAIEAPEGATWTHVVSEIDDVDTLVETFSGADAVIHLAGLASERPWHDILSVNIDGTRNVLEAARIAGVRRVLLASSIHAVGFETPAGIGDVPVPLPRPDTYYGVSKAAMEALGSLYADRFDMTVVSARICAFGDAPEDDLGVATWLSVDDATRLVEAVGALDRAGHSIVWGVSANAADWFPRQAGEAIGFFPQDDAEELVAREGLELRRPDRSGVLGGLFADDDHPIGEEW